MGAALSLAGLAFVPEVALAGGHGHGGSGGFGQSMISGHGSSFRSGFDSRMDRNAIQDRGLFQGADWMTGSVTTLTITAAGVLTNE